MSDQTPQQISIYDRIQDPMEGIQKLGEMIASSGMFGCTKKEQGLLLAFSCFCERKNPMEIMRTYHIMDGKLSMRADAMLAEFIRSGGRVQWLEYTDTIAKATFSHNGQDIVSQFTIEDAQKAGLIREKSGWAKFPAAMLRARLISQAIRMIAPGIVAGLYNESEIVEEAKPTLLQAKAKVIEAPAKVPLIEAQPVQETQNTGDNFNRLGTTLSREDVEYALKRLLWPPVDQLDDTKISQIANGIDRFEAKVRELCTERDKK